MRLRCDAITGGGKHVAEAHAVLSKADLVGHIVLLNDKFGPHDGHQIGIAIVIEIIQEGRAGPFVAIHPGGLARVGHGSVGILKEKEIWKCRRLSEIDILKPVAVHVSHRQAMTGGRAGDRAIETGSPMIDAIL